MSTVAVLVIAGTGRPYLLAALSSLVSQNFGDWEAVVVECCADPTATQMVHECVAKIADERIRLVNYPDDRSYPPRAAKKWNFALTQCTAPLVAFLDDDDAKGDGWLEAMCRPLLESPELATTISWGRVIDKNGNVGGPVFGRPSLNLEVLTRPEFITTGQIVVRRTALAEIGAFDEDLLCSEDWDLALQLARFPWRYVDSVSCYKRDDVNNACYHPEVGGHTQNALRRIVSKHGLAPSTCEGCGSTAITFVRAVSGKGFRLWCGADCARRSLGE